MLVRARHLVLNFSRPVKRLLMLLADISICLFSTWIEFALRLDAWFDFSVAQWRVFAICAAISLPIFIHHGLYRAVFRFTGWPVPSTSTPALELQRIIKLIHVKFFLH